MSIASIYDKKQTRDGIKLNKGFLIPVNKIYIEDNFNIREIDTTHVDNMVEAIKKASGSMRLFPAILVAETARGIKVIDGHHRLLAAIKAGIEFVECKDVSGMTEAEYLPVMVNSTEGKKLTASERANAYLRMYELGMTHKQIAESVHRSEADVQIHLSFIGVSEELKRRVDAGQISYSQAVDLNRDKTIENPEKLVDLAVEKAREKGKEKVTPKILAETKAETVEEVKPEKEKKEIASATSEKKDISPPVPEVKFIPTPEYSAMSRDEMRDMIVDLLDRAAPIVLGGNEYLLLRSDVKASLIAELLAGIKIK